MAKFGKKNIAIYSSLVCVVAYGILFLFPSKNPWVYIILITVSGIGPKGGLSILSTLSSDDLRFAILSGDSKAISKAPGIGSKTAQRVIIDLKDKMSLEEAFEKKIENRQIYAFSCKQFCHIMIKQFHV